MFSRICKPLFLALSLLAGIFFASSAAHASIIYGTIDPDNNNRFYAALLNDSGFGLDTLRINFGKFTSQIYSGIAIDDTGLQGFAWGELVGWIVMDCGHTVSGCSSTNDNFKVSVNSTGVLSGYAWGENTGWINFGPFTNPDISQVQIDYFGKFNGTLGDAGYAWSENFGWILFDCSNEDTCIRTDYQPSVYRPQCSNNLDDDEDGDIDYPDDSGCNNIFDNRESRGMISGNDLPQCSNFIDDDRDGYTDYPNDRGCSNRLDGSEADTIVVPPPTPTPPIPEPPYVPRPPLAFPPISGGTIFPSQPDIALPPTIIEKLPPIVTHIIEGRADLPEAKDALIEMIKNALRTLKDFFDHFIQFVRGFMTISSGKDLVEKISWLGLAFIVFVSLLIAIVVPIAGPSEMKLWVPFIIKSLSTALGMRKADPLWGTVVISGTNEPLSLAKVSLWSNGAFVANTVAQADGSFGFLVPEGSYTLSVESDGKRLPLLPSNAPLGVPYVGETIMQTPTLPLVLGVGDNTYPPTTKRQHVLLNREVSLMNAALFMFGVGSFAALLHVIFYPGLAALIVLLLYALIAVLRELGVFGSYASIYMDKLQNQPLSGRVVKVLDMNTRKVIHTTLTTRFGRAYLNLPKGYYAITLSKLTPAGLPPETITTPLFATRGGMHRIRLRI
jgi:hypothetical protein